MTAPLKLLSDFDGVWTNQGPEAVALLDYTIARLAELASVDVQQARADAERFTASMRARPHEHGWAPDGRISAFFDEDPLVGSSALCRYLDTEADAAAYREAVLAGGFDSLAKFSEVCFVEATAMMRKEHPPCIIDDAAEVLRAFEDAGVEVVVISNSSADKIAHWFDQAGIDAGEGTGHRVRLRGSAAKWMLGDTDACIEVEGRSIRVDRPRYRAAIEAENPDMIIGDVFSLDLALPHTMRVSGDAAAPERLALRAHDHTPDWILKSRAGGAIDHVVKALAELPALLDQLRVQRS